MSEQITIIGASFGGLCTAISLQRLGIQTKIFELAPNRRSIDAGIVLGANAMKVLNTLGVGEAIQSEGYTQDSYTIFSSNGKILTTSSYVDSFVPTYTSISRTKLLDILISQLKPGTLYYNKKISYFKQTTDGLHLYFEDGTTELTNYLIAADGIHSTIRNQLLPNQKLRFSGFTSWRGIAKDCPKYLSQTLSETWGPKGKIGIIPLKDNHVYWYAYKNCKADDPELREWRMNDLLFNFYAYHVPIPQILDRMNNEDILYHDIYDLEPLSQYKYGRIVLLGDAAHAALPTMGQGANQAIEDALSLSYCFANTETVEQAFQEFEILRFDSTNHFVNNAWKLGKASQRSIPALWEYRDKLIQHNPTTL